ncbi:Cna B-type domain-containing protein [Lactobacillus helveticus]|uniref:collagen binding domain-containing protein n=1 Tax=Lactobacillus helveticus TaxID=1587 RepID=UPI00207C3055|nr:collagen binding domain-containing protein [Lactobacillus helveticus]MCO0806975.1 Cna B-type domain-containing protein [Lactobacillus helveticus]
MSNKSRHRRLLFMMGLVLFSLLGLIWISSNNGMTVYADSKTNITHNGTGSGSVINQHEEQQTSTVNSNTTDNTNSSDDQTSQKPVTNTEAQPRAPAEQNGTGSVINQHEEQQISTVNSNTTDNTNSSDDQTSQKPVTNTEAQPRAPAEQNNMSMYRSMFISMLSERTNSVNNITNTKEDDRDWGDQFITKAELQDESGNPKTDFGIHDNMQAAWNFVIPANKAKSGDTMTVAIPSVLTLATMTNFDITDAGGTVIGRAAANPNTGKVTITLTDAVKNNHNTITGSFKLWVNWTANKNANKIEKNKLVSVNWGTSGSTNIHVEPSNGPDPNEVLNKWGWYDTNNPYIIHWRVRINYAGKTINQAVYTDRVDDNQALVPGSVSVYKVKHQSDSSNFNILSTYPSSSTIENGTSVFTTTLGDISSQVVIDYKTKITNNGISGHYKNNGKLAGSNIEKQTIDVYSPINGGNGNADTIITISGTKTWKDNNNQDGVRPSSITVNLLSNGKQVQSKKVSASDNWQYSFDNLPAYANGKKITYTVTENADAGYTSTVDDYNITNTHKPTTPKPQVPNKPTKPVVPTKPAKPVVPTKPAKPAKPVVPTKPAKPVVPTKPTTPKPQVPNKPTKPVVPAKPVVPTKPTKPVVPAKPVVPTKPAKPVVPAKPAKPVVPTKPTTPKKPQVPNTTTPKKPQVPNTTTPKKPQVPNNGNKVTPKAYTQGKTYEKTGKLPQTGDKSSMGMMLIGLVTLLLSLGLAVISRFTI